MDGSILLMIILFSTLRARGRRVMPRLLEHLERSPDLGTMVITPFFHLEPKFVEKLHLYN